MKFNVGDTVRIKDDLVVGRKYNDIEVFVSDMIQYKGCVGVIEDADEKMGNRYKLKEIEWNFTDDMLESVECIKGIKDENKNNNIHLNGYIFDSLVYRYQLALYKASFKDAEDIMIRENISKKEAEAKARQNYNRDLVRFIEILEEGIKSHD